MKGDPKVLEYLNGAIKLELTAINQYFLHARMYEDMGLFELGKHEYDESIEEMRHADKLIQREGHAYYKEAIGYCESAGDYVTRDLFSSIQADEEEHIDYLETQLDQVDRLGLQNYLQSQTGNPNQPSNE